MEKSKHTPEPVMQTMLRDLRALMRDQQYQVTLLVFQTHERTADEQRSLLDQLWMQQREVLERTLATMVEVARIAGEDPEKARQVLIQVAGRDVITRDAGSLGQAMPAQAPAAPSVPFVICPYCAKELRLPKTPQFCPFCREPLV